VPFDRSKSVLVVDDNFAIIRIVKALLNAQGVLDVEGAGSGPEAIRKLSQKSFGLVICDFFMMPMNGIDLKVIMDRREEFSGIPFLLMTTKEETFDRSKFEKVKLQHILLKPFTGETLMNEIDKVADAAR
jgi:two-component system chemotaxis response regulator CheY